MTVRVTIHPIDWELLDKLKIKENPTVENRRVGSVITSLAKKGYTNQNIYYWEDRDGGPELQIHCKKGA